MKPALLLAPLLGAALMGGSTVSTGAAARAASGGVARAGAVVPATGGNALRAHRRLYVNRESAAAQAARELAAQGRGDDAGLLRWLAAQPTAIWFTGNTTDTERLRVVMRKASATRTVPVVVAYNIPFRDCGGQSANGAISSPEYQAWIRSLAAVIGRRSIVLILEPDAIPHAVSGCLSQSAVQERFGLLSYATRVLKQNPKAAVYLDAGNAGWIAPVTRLIAPLRASGISSADGFALNVSNFRTTAHTIEYGRALSRRLGGAHFVIDTGRNGNGAAPPQADGSPSWCNPPGRAVGHLPTTRTGHAEVDAFLWVKPPGMSDGACRPGEPPAGQWWTEYALDLVRARHVPSGP